MLAEITPRHDLTTDSKYFHRRLGRYWAPGGGSTAQDRQRGGARGGPRDFRPHHGAVSFLKWSGSVHLVNCWLRRGWWRAQCGAYGGHHRQPAVKTTESEGSGITSRNRRKAPIVTDTQGNLLTLPSQRHTGPGWRPGRPARGGVIKADAGYQATSADGGEACDQRSRRNAEGQGARTRRWGGGAPIRPDAQGQRTGGGGGGSQAF